jgi:hypothetical protein
MACAKRSLSLGLGLGLLLLGSVLGSGCQFSTSGVRNPVAVDDPDAGGNPVPIVPDAGITITDPAGMPSRDAATSPDLAPPGDGPRPDATIVVGPAGWIGAPLVIGVGQGGRRLVSPDGVAWSGELQDANGDSDPTKHLLAVTYAGGLVVAVGGGCAGGHCAGRIVTFNGERWTEAALPPQQGWLAAVAYGGGAWVAAGAGGETLVSSDGKRWTARGTLPTHVRALAYGSVGGVSMFVAVGDDGSRARSLDGQSWSDVARGFPGADGPVALRSVAIGDGTVVAAGEAGRRIRSRNGVDWTDPAAGGNDLTSMVFADRTFLAYADNGIVFLSPDDGRTWNPQTLVDPPSNSVVTGMMAGARLYVAARAQIIMTSPNGLAWNERLDSGAADANALAAFVFAGY